MSRRRIEPRVTVDDSAAFCKFLMHLLPQIDGAVSAKTLSSVDALIASLGAADSSAVSNAEATFYGRLNQKLSVNGEVLAAIYSRAAKSDVTFNYPTKKAIAWAVDSSNQEAFESVLARACPSDALRADLVKEFRPASGQQTRDRLAAEALQPSKLRKKLAREVASDVLEAAVGPLVWSLWNHIDLGRYFAEQTFGSPSVLSADYMADLQVALPHMFRRDRSLVVRKVHVTQRSDGDFLAQRDALTQWLASEFFSLDNYGHVAVILAIDPDVSARAWELIADLTLFAERFDTRQLKAGYFRPADVARETLAHIPTIDTSAAKFDLSCEGFTYKDTFVLTDSRDEPTRLVLILQKNLADETVVPCPACRSLNVRGNSYPSFGVKSWECRNQLCPDRSIYNRGKRYSFKALLMQAAIERPDNEIPVASVRRWQRDVLDFLGDDEIVATLTRHYSDVGEQVVVLDEDPAPASSLARRVSSDLPLVDKSVSSEKFWSGPFFARYQVPLPEPRGRGALPEFSPNGAYAVLEGDCAEVLRSLPPESFDRAVTSPPYFNAREYSQWPNLYTYLADMMRVSFEVYRVLKPGGIYAFNIFDYFDNERIITFSAMGDKRLTLSSLMVDVFRRVGFRLVGCVPWFKGEIQGKRGFNAGNFSPFYQAPFNCWEHVLLVQRPGETVTLPVPGQLANSIARISPVWKMVRGENRLGHTAPFPIELPRLLLQDLAPGSLVLDPYGGSGTTARAAIDLELSSVLIEKDPTYATLSRDLIASHVLDQQNRPEPLW